MICDIGGGTTEVAVMSLGDLVASRSVRVAGDKMDQAIVDYLHRHYSLRIGIPAAERLKIDLGSAAPLEQEQVAEIGGLDSISGLPRKALVTSEEVRQALLEPLDAILDAVKSTLDHLTPDLAADVMDNGLVLCGGGSLLRNLDHYVAQQIGLPVRVASEPLTTVAKGMLICMEHLDQWRATLASSDDDV
jgi:rod shape-determining protein MreB